MMKHWWRAALVAAAVAVPGFGQDSTSLDWQLGDCLYAWDTTLQVKNFVVDTSEFTGSWGTKYRVAPLVKASNTSSLFQYPSSLVSSQAISDTLLKQQAFPFTSYMYWNQPTYGINPYLNLPGTNINTSGWVGNQFAVALSQYATSDATGVDINGIVGAVVNYKPLEPTRMYVARVETAINGPTDAVNDSQFGLGAVDSHGQVHFRAEIPPGSGATNNLFRVRMIDPDGAGPKTGRQANRLNYIGGAGANDPNATDWVLVGSGVIHSCPSIIPQQVAGRPVMIAGNFNNQYVYEKNPYPATMTTDTTHQAAGFSQQRGNISFSARLKCDPNAVGTAGLLSYNGGSIANAFNMWETKNDGSVLNKYALIAPTALALPNGYLFGPPAEFDHYHSQTAYRGGPQIAIGKAQNGKGLAAGIMYDKFAYNNNLINPYNALVVARFDCGGLNPEWAVAAFVNQVSDSGTPATTNPAALLDDVWDGSPIYDGTGTAIGRLAPRYAITPFDPNDQRYGPSISTAAMDSVGNLYFIATMELYYDPNDPNDNRIRTGLLRAVYAPATFTYKLELMLRMYYNFDGKNSGTPWEIRYLALNDVNSIDSGSLWSNNILQNAFNDMSTVDMPTSDPTALGGLVIQAGITYDSDGDGDFGWADPNDPNNLNADDEYNVLLYIQPSICIGDLNCDGQVDFGDINPFVKRISNPAGYAAEYPTCAGANADINASGAVGFDDINAFVGLLSTGSLPIVCP